jgi:hypothetical protein
VTLARSAGTDASAECDEGGHGKKGKEPRRPRRKPRSPDGEPEDGCDGRPLPDGTEEDEGTIQPGNLWRCTPEVQIVHVKAALRRLTSAMMKWNDKASNEDDAARRTEIDKILADIWKRRELRMMQLRWLKSEIPVEP